MNSQTGKTTLIPRKLLFGNPDRAGVQLSPDGAQLAWLAARDGVLNVWVAPRTNPSAARAVTSDTGRGIGSYFWAHTNSHIIYMQDKNGDENWRLFAVDLGTGAIRDLTPFAATQARVLGVSEKIPHEIVVGLNNRNAQWHDVHRINILTGEMSLLLQHDRFQGVSVDDDYHVRFAYEPTPDGGFRYHVPAGDDWVIWDTIPTEDIFTTGAHGFDQTNRLIYMSDSRGRDTAALVEIDLQTKAKHVLAFDPQADVSDVIKHPTKKHVQAVSFVYDRKRWQILDAAIKPDMELLGRVSSGEIQITSRSLDDRFWTVAFNVDDGPARYYLYDRQARAASFLFSNRAALEGLPLVKMHSAVIKSRDGLDLIVYYSLPAACGANSIPAKPQPLVFIPHGGPWWRDHWGFHPWHQWLTNRGYAVMSVNFRSSTGFGKAFTNAGDLEWGGKIMDDQQDAVQWAIKTGIADPRRVAVMGGSFGGFSTLAGVTFHPTVFACAVAIVGPANLITFIESIPPYWKPMFELLAHRVGDPRTEAGRALLVKHSPLTYVDHICRPLLIGHGANDPRVKQAESDQIVNAMRAKGIPVTYVLYPDEGHGFARPANNISFMAIAEAFLAQHLGGSYEPIGGELKGASLTVPIGADGVPGLATALGGR